MGDCEQEAEAENNNMHEMSGGQVTENQKELGRHALGLPNNHRTSFRNHFCAGVDHSDYADWMDMVQKGYATRRKGNEITGGDDVFWLTKAGAIRCLMPSENLDEADFR
jgi:hypothetical protein